MVDLITETVSYLTRVHRRHLVEDTIATRRPAGMLYKRGQRDMNVDDPDDQTMGIDIPTMKRNKKSFEANMKMLANSKHYRDIDKRELKGLTPEEIAERYINHFKDNILHVHDNVPKAIREVTRRWYDGAHSLASRRALEYRLPKSSIAAVYAALSPNNEWNNNVALGDRVLEHYHKKQNHPWSKEMDNVARDIWKAKDQVHLDKIRGKTLSQLKDPVEKAMWIRTHDEAHNSKDHYQLAPTGEFTTKLGQKTSWQTTPMIAKAISAIESGGDTQKISAIMGQKHKIRNFYNNIIAPNSSRGDVTVDTHAVAAAHLKPYGGKAMPVLHNFASSLKKADQGPDWTPVKNDPKKTGIQGTYPLYQEAYRRAAAERGVLPREMQSITWEGIRDLFPTKHKNRGLAPVHEIWDNHHAGKITADEARRQVYDLAAHVKNGENS